MHVNSNNVMDGWETDAYLLALTRPASAAGGDPDQITRCVVSCGSYLRRDATILLDSLSKVDALFRSGRKTEVWLRGQNVMELALRCPDRPDALVVNDHAEAFTYDAKERLVRFRAVGPATDRLAPA